MRNNQRDFVQNISEKLSWIATLIENENKANFTGLATITEGFFKHFLNLLFDWNLGNLNESHQNSKGIDLVSETDKIIVQVSSDCSKEKIQSSLDKIDIHHYSDFHFIFLGIKNLNRQTYKHFSIPNGIHFYAQEDIWTIPKILTSISNVEIKKLEALSNMVDDYFESCKKPIHSNSESPDVRIEQSKSVNELIGYCINFGMNCCRVFEIYSKESELKETEPISYGMNFPMNYQDSKKARNEFKDEILRISNNTLHEKMASGYFVKVIADAEFSELFPGNEDRDLFIEKYYKTTGHYFNILTQKQTEDNMKELFTDIAPSTAIIDICSTCVHVVLKTDKSKFKSYLVKISTKDIQNYTRNDDWDNSIILSLKEYIKKIISPTFKRVKAKQAIIIKDEKYFMDKMGYPLRIEGGNMKIGYDEYIKANRDRLYPKNFIAIVDKIFSVIDKNRRKKYYGFKEGHIILETIFETLEVEDIIPTDVPNILRSPFAHIFNVVLSGSTKPGHAEYMQKAYNLFKEKFNVNVLSPDINAMKQKSQDSYQRQEQAIKRCDLLFVCNGDGYIGQQTKCDIYGAYLLSKPIAYWINPKNLGRNSGELDYSSYIPHDTFKNLLDEYYPVSSYRLKGCIIGSFRKYYKEMVGIIERFEKNGIDILSPKKSTIINPNDEFVILASDDGKMSENQIQDQVFEHEQESDFVYVWDPDGYIGRTTSYEIGRIIERGTHIFYKEKPKDIPLEIPIEDVLDVEKLIDRLKENIVQFS